MYHEMFRDLLTVVSMHISGPQSRTVPMYIAFWQLHSLLYLEKSRDIWDSAVAPVRALSQITRDFSRYRGECNCQKAIYMGKFRDRQQLTYLGNVYDTPTAVPIPPSLQALRISRNVS